MCLEGTTQSTCFGNWPTVSNKDLPPTTRRDRNLGLEHQSLARIKRTLLNQLSSAVSSHAWLARKGWSPSGAPTPLPEPYECDSRRDCFRVCRLLDPTALQPTLHASDRSGSYTLLPQIAIAPGSTSTPTRATVANERIPRTRPPGTQPLVQQSPTTRSLLSGGAENAT